MPITIFTGLSRYADPWHPVAETSTEIAVAAHVAAGGALLAVHSSATGFPEWPGWAVIIGASWTRGTSGHPEISLAVFEADPSAVDHPVLSGLAPISGVTDRPSVVCYDERYWRMTVGDGNTPLLGHDTLGDWHVMGWARSPHVLFDGLGHDKRSYTSAHRRLYLANEIRWLLGEL